MNHGKQRIWVEWWPNGCADGWDLYLFIAGQLEQVAERNGVIAPYEDLATQERYEQELIDSYVLPF